MVENRWILLISFAVVNFFIGTYGACDIDLGFILDDSGSITNSAFQQQVDFVKSLSSKFTIGQYNTLTSLITFSDDPKLHYNFRDYAGYSSYGLSNFLRNIKRTYGNTRTDKALELARSSMFTNDAGERSNKPNILMVITDGNSQSGISAVERASLLLHNKGVNVFAIGVGSSVNSAELRAIASENRNTFHVSYASLLNTIVSRVKEIGCSSVSCSYRDCHYNSWSSWSRTCGQVSRTRSLYTYSSLKRTTRIGGCAGLVSTCKSTQTENKLLQSCPSYTSFSCAYKDCSYYSWSSWSATCGGVTRTRRLYYAYSRRKSVFSLSECNKYTKTCSSTESVQKTLANCPVICKYKDCYYRSWTSWSATCGSVKRIRKFSYSYSRSKQVTQASDCDQYRTTCASTLEGKKTLTACPTACQYKDCSYYSWSKWSATCGAVTRSRKLYRANKKTGYVPSTSDCSKYSQQQSCQSTETEQKDRAKCPIICKYKDCYYHSWTSWSATCGSVKRIRKFSYSYSRSKQVIQASDCDQYRTTCASTLEGKKTLTACPIACPYKDCSYYSWSKWSATCGAVTRSRKLYRAYTRTGYVPSTSDCSKYSQQQSCHSTETEQKDRAKCPIICKYKDCYYRSWTSWSATCGSVKRIRKFSYSYSRSKQVTQASDCDQYRTTCASTLEGKKTLTACPIACQYKDCSYYSWSKWSATCGAVTRSRKLYRANKKTGYVPSTSDCSKYSQQQSCQSTETEQKDRAKCPIICKYKDCYYRSWTSWSATCGSVKRIRKFSYSYSRSKQVTQASDCDQYKTTCASTLEGKKTLTACPIACPYKDCSYYSWSKWSATCGAVTRSRKLYRAYTRTGYVPSTSDCSKYSQQQSCHSTETEQKDRAKCPIICKYKDCYYRSWTSWSATCGSVKRIRKFSYSYSRSKQVTQASDCDQYRTTCASTLEGKKTLTACPIACPYKDCSYYSWSKWSATCGAVTRSRKLYRANKKTGYVPSTSNCTKYSQLQSCQSTQAEQQTKSICPITCKYKSCRYDYSWSKWSGICGNVTRTKQLYREYDMSKRVKPTVCDSYLKVCDNEMKETKVLRTCPPKQHCILDLGVILDESSSISKSEFEAEKEFIKFLTNSLTIGVSETRVSLLGYSYSTKFHSKLRDYAGYSKTGLDNLLDKIKMAGGSRATEKALKAASADMFTLENGARDGVSKVLIVITDGQSNEGKTRVKRAADQLKKEYVNIFAVGVGRNAKNDELLAMASDSSYVLQASSFDALTTIMSKLSEAMCAEKTCKYKECHYESWSLWSKSCGTSTRTRKLRIAYDRVKKQHGGCSGLVTSCNDEDKENKKLGKCPIVPEKECDLDLGVILDESSSIYSPSNFKKETDFVKDLTSHFAIGPSSTRVSVITFSTNARLRFKFNEYEGYSKTGLNNALDGLVLGGGSTATEKALDLARTEMFTEKNGQRNNVSKVLLVVTDGNSNHGAHRVGQSSELLKSQGINVFAIGVGSVNYKELAAIATGSKNIFQVGSLSHLASAVNGVRRASCTAVNCQYKECEYYSWSGWSATCGTRASRSRKLSKSYDRQIERFGGCAGLNTTCDAKQQETKTLDSCNKFIVSCKHYVCTWSSWSQYSTTCGKSMKRTRYVIETLEKKTHIGTCPDTLNAKPCTKELDVQNKSSKCPCRVEKCHWYDWSSWSATCGHVTRSRKLSRFNDYNYEYDCVESQKKFGCQEDEDEETQQAKKNPCTQECKYAECVYNPWSNWSGTCGTNSRTRSAKKTMKTTRKVTCDGLRKDCSDFLKQTQERKKTCSCKYVECQPGTWSAWSTTCGKGSRLRAIAQIRLNVERYDCSGLKQNCPKKSETEERNQLCECDYVECKPDSWSSWSAPCGNATRTRSIDTVQKTVQKASCNGLQTTCPSSIEQTSRATLCKCSVASCDWEDWGEWSATCGDVTRTRKISTKMFTVQKLSCEGLTQTCMQPPQTESKKVKCKCSIDTCNWLEWSSWSATCGQVTRSRKLKNTQETIQAYDCDEMKEEMKCRETESSQGQDASREPCTQRCDYVECSYNDWSSWSGSCGLNITRMRTVKSTAITKELPSCEGLLQDCSSMDSQIQKTAIKCSCDAVDCVPGSWSSWSSECGQASRRRDVSTVQKKLEKYNCDGLTQTCDKDEDTEKRDTLCTCNYVECVPAAWSSWSATCGKLTRSRSINEIQKTVQKASCDGLKKQCVKSQESEEKDTLCTCSVAECEWNDWSSWSATCGDSSRVRTISTTMKSVQKLSCDGLQQQCTEQPKTEKRSSKCPPPPPKASPCRYVDCVPDVWSTWSSECGQAQRSRNINAVIKRVTLASCDGLLQKCPKSEENESRNKLCTCNYVECVEGQWSDWSTECGKGVRTRPINVLQKTVEKYSCEGLNLNCLKEEDFEDRNELCECSTVDCVPAAWSSWSSECGQGQRTRSINAVQKTVKKSSCDGLQTTCQKQEENEDRNKTCTCNYVECEPGTWTEWSNDCGEASRSRPISAILKTVEKYNCDGLRQTCSKNVEVENRNEKCTCEYVECSPAEWSEWSEQCGKKIQRSRLINVVQKYVEKYSCEGLTTKCDKAEEYETKDKLCECNYVECEWSAWSEPSKSCGRVSYQRSIKETARTKKRYNCDGLKQSCMNYSVQQKGENIKCKCDTVECAPGSWTSWSSDCGQASRSRPINIITKVVEKLSCDGSLQTCDKHEEVEERNAMCECSTVDCVPAAWSSWSSECGQGQRTRSINAVEKTVKKSSCDGLQTTCPKQEENEDRNKTCTCNYVECQPGTWTEWSNDCGEASRSRPISVIVKTIEKYDCDGLQQTCSKNVEVDNRVTNCTCDYVECLPGKWSEWSAECGNIKRSRIINVVEKTVQSESCEGLNTSCPRLEDVQSQQEMCTCSVMKCEWSLWSVWSATCGHVTRERKIIGRLTTERKLSCDAVTMCTQKPEIETKRRKCPGGGTASADLCHIKYRALGCFHDDQKRPRPLPELILTERDPSHRAWNKRLINWKKWDSYHVEFICRCAAKAKEMKYTFFSTQFFGECWSGPEAGDTYFRNGEKDYKHCIKSGFKPCSPGDGNCVGEQYTNYVYKLD